MSTVAIGSFVRIMVVDDDPDTVTVLARYLQREGFATLEALQTRLSPRCVAVEIPTGQENA